MLSKRAIIGLFLGSGAVVASTVPGGLGNLWLTNEFNKYSEKGFKQVYDTTAFGNTVTYFVTPLILPLNAIISGVLSGSFRKLRYCLLFNLCVIAGLTYYYIGDGYLLLQKLKKVDELRTQKKLLLEGRD
jgi:hypothetical protein